MRLFSRISKFLSPLIYLFIVPSFAFAQGVNVSPIPSGNFPPLASLGASNFVKILGNVITIAFFLSALIALVFLVFCGVKWITSGGDKSAIEVVRYTILA